MRTSFKNFAIPHRRVGQEVIRRDVQDVVLVRLNQCTGINTVDDDSSALEAIWSNNVVGYVKDVVDIGGPSERCKTRGEQDESHSKTEHLGVTGEVSDEEVG